MYLVFPQHIVLCWHGMHLAEAVEYNPIIPLIILHDIKARGIPPLLSTLQLRELILHLNEFFSSV